MTECEFGLNPITVYHRNHPRPPSRDASCSQLPQMIHMWCATANFCIMCVCVYVQICKQFQYTTLYQFQMFTKVAYTYESNVFSMFACKHAEASNITSHHQSLEIFVRAASILSNSDPTLANYKTSLTYMICEQLQHWCRK